MLCKYTELYRFNSENNRQAGPFRIPLFHWHKAK